MQEERRIICRHVRSVKSEFLGATYKVFELVPWWSASRETKAAIQFSCFVYLKSLRLLLLSHCKMGILWDSFKTRQLFLQGLAYGTHSMILFLAYLPFFFSPLCIIHKPTLTPIEGVLAWKFFQGVMSAAKVQHLMSPTPVTAGLSPALPSPQVNLDPPPSSQIFTKLNLWSLRETTLRGSWGWGTGVQPAVGHIPAAYSGTWAVIWLGFLQLHPYHNANNNAT